MSYSQNCIFFLGGVLDLEGTLMIFSQFLCTKLPKNKKRSILQETCCSRSLRNSITTDSIANFSGDNRLFDRSVHYRLLIPAPTSPTPCEFFLGEPKENSPKSSKTSLECQISLSGFLTSLSKGSIDRGTWPPFSRPPRHEAPSRHCSTLHGP